MEKGYLCKTAINDLVNRASVTETTDSSSIPNEVKSKTIKIGILSFLLDVQHFKGQQCEASTLCGRQMAA